MLADGLAPEPPFFRFRVYYPLCELAVPIPLRQTPRVTAVLLLAAFGASQQALCAEAAPQTRFSGAATLATLKPASGDGRFQLDAVLSVSTQPSGDGRFSLSAKLKPNPKSVAGVCVPLGDLIFRNGFE